MKENSWLRIEYAIHHLKRGRAGGAGDVSPEHLKFSGSIFRNWLCQILNHICKLEQMHDIITPAFKGKGRDPLFRVTEQGIANLYISYGEVWENAFSKGLITEKIVYEISKSWDCAKDFRISGKISRFSGKISRFHGDFKISLKISGFPERLCKINFQISMKISARFLDFNEDICKISRF